MPAASRPGVPERCHPAPGVCSEYGGKCVGFGSRTTAESYRIGLPSKGLRGGEALVAAAPQSPGLGTTDLRPSDLAADHRNIAEIIHGSPFK